MIKAIKNIISRIKDRRKFKIYDHPVKIIAVFPMDRCLRVETIIQKANTFWWFGYPPKTLICRQLTYFTPHTIGSFNPDVLNANPRSYAEVNLQYKKQGWDVAAMPANVKLPIYERIDYDKCFADDVVITNEYIGYHLPVYLYSKLKELKNENV